jgi:hypothetical protein
MQQFVQPPEKRVTPGALKGMVRGTAVTTVTALAAFVVAACGGAAKAPPNRQDVATIAASVSDIAYQCQAVAAGYVAGVDGASIRKDVTALLRVSRRVRPDAPFSVGALRTTLHSELALAQANLEGQGCAAGQARRLAGAVDQR